MHMHNKIHVLSLRESHAYVFYSGRMTIKEQSIHIFVYEVSTKLKERKESLGLICVQEIQKINP